MEEQKLSPRQALPKIKKFCAYQERCHLEVMEKLEGYGLQKNDAQEIITKLTADNYLNEERFAINYAGGKFRIKQWGRIKIKYQLRKRQVSASIINKALAGIDDSDYLATLVKLATLKFKSLKNEKNIYIKNKKLQDHLKMKGYEGELINDVLREIGK